MASEQARAIRAALRVARDSGTGTALSRSDQLAASDQVGDTATEPAGVRFEDADAHGVPCQWATPNDADPRNVLVYFHGGGYCYCSVNSHRKVVGHIAKAAACRALNVGYRLAPEHPYPAAVWRASSPARVATLSPVIARSAQGESSTPA